IIVRVNDSIISRSELQRQRELLRQEMQQQGADAAKIAARDKDVLRDAIDQQLLLDKAKELGLNADNEVVKRIGDMMKEANVNTMEELEKIATGQGEVRRCRQEVFRRPDRGAGWRPGILQARGALQKSRRSDLCHEGRRSFRRDPHQAGICGAEGDGTYHRRCSSAQGSGTAGDG